MSTTDPVPQGAEPSPPARKVLSGPIYRDFVRAMLARKGARNYLEIGVHNGSSLALAECPSIGVDPKFVFDLRNGRDPRPGTTRRILRYIAGLEARR